VGSVIVVDNSEVPSAGVADELVATGCAYIPKNANIGVAAALNIAAETAIAAGYRYLLTMDQDSFAIAADFVASLKACCKPDVGLVAPFLLPKHCNSAPKQTGCKTVQTAMTSGSLLDLDIYRQVGALRDDLFIDFVDIEYCLRLRRHGYRIVQASGAMLEHQVGSTVGAGFFNVTTHPPLRKYYKTRNRLQVWKEYGGEFPFYIWKDRIRFVLEFIRLLLFEPDKKNKLCMMWRGYLDYRLGMFGKYEETGEGLK